MNELSWEERLIRILNRIFRHKPCFSVGDVVGFEPDERTVGWTQDFEGLYPGYIGCITKVEQNWLGEWIFYVDDKPAGFGAGDFRLV